MRQPAPDHRVDLAALADQALQLGRDARRRLRVRARLVQHVDGLVGTRPVGHEAVGQHDRGLEGVVGDGDGVMPLQPRPARHEDFPRLDGIQLLDGDGLEPALQRRVAPDPAIVLPACRRPDQADVAAHQGRLQHVRRIHGGAQGRPLTDEVVQLVHEEDEVGVGGERGDEPADALFVLAPEGGAREQGDVIERHEARVLERRRHVTGRDALRQALGDRRLSDAGLADQGGIVLTLAQQDIDDAGDLAVAAPHRLEVAPAGLGREIDAHPLEHVARVEQPAERVAHRLSRLARTAGTIG